MKNTLFSQSVLLFRKAIWLFVFMSIFFFKYTPATNFFAGFCEQLSLITAESQREISKQAGKNESIPFSNSGEEHSDSDTQNKDLQASNYSKARRIVSQKSKLFFNGLFYALIKQTPKDAPFPRYFSNLSNTCFASLHRFSVF